MEEEKLVSNKIKEIEEEWKINRPA